MQVGRVPREAGMERDHYSILGVNRFASRQAIKRAYRARIREVHPDLHPTDAIASDRARDVIEAYRVLRDPDSRRRYDSTRAATAPIAPVYACDGPCPLWVTRFVAILVFFAVAAGLFYIVATSVWDSTPVYRPSMGMLSAPPARTPRRDATLVQRGLETAPVAMRRLRL